MKGIIWPFVVALWASNSMVCKLESVKIPEWVQINTNQQKVPIFIISNGIEGRSSRVKRSQFFAKTKEKKSEDSQTERVFSNGLDGLDSLLKPSITPSFGLHFGNPYGYGYGNILSGNGYGSPFRFNMGPLSINPFGGVRVSFQNGKPHIRPSLDVLISHNKQNRHYQSYAPNYSYSPPSKNPFKLFSQSPGNYYRYQPTKFFPSKDFRPSIPLNTNLNYNYASSYPSVYNVDPYHQQTPYYTPTRTAVLFPGQSSHLNSNSHFDKFKHLKSSIFGHGKSDDSSVTGKDAGRDQIYRKE